MTKLIYREDGSILTEYGLLVVLVAIGLIIALTAFRESIIGQFDYIIGQITGAR